MLRLRTENGVRLVEVSGIYLIDILRHYITIHTNAEKIRSYGVLSEIESQLPDTFGDEWIFTGMVITDYYLT